MTGFLVQLRKSIFVKLFFVIVMTGAAILAVLFVGLPRIAEPTFEPRFHSNAEQYAKYLISDLGEFPHFEKGKALCNRLGIQIRIEGDGWSWSSSPDVPTIASIPHRGPFPGVKNKKGPGPFFRLPPPHRGPGGPSVVVEHVFAKGPAKVLVLSSMHPIFEFNYAMLAGMIGAILMVLVLSYVLIRWLLSPIHSLMTAVNQISAGNLEYQVPIESADELGRLAKAFNAMVVRVRQMVLSKQQLLIDVSHELRSPLTRAKIGLELMDENENTARATRDLNELDQMIEELLESARMDNSSQALFLEDCDLVIVCRDLVAQHSALGQSVKFHSESPAALAPVDVRRFKSVLRNLVENALKYSPAGKPVEVRIQSDPDFIRIRVKDEGMGIPEGEMGRVFEPFYRVDKSRTRKTGGFGLGLSLCKKIVEAHGGRIYLESQPDKGTTAVVEFPTSQKMQKPA